MWNSVASCEDGFTFQAEIFLKQQVLNATTMGLALCTYLYITGQCVWLSLVALIICKHLNCPFFILCIMWQQWPLLYLLPQRHYQIKSSFTWSSHPKTLFGATGDNSGNQIWMDWFWIDVFLVSIIWLNNHTVHHRMYKMLWWIWF